VTVPVSLAALCGRVGLVLQLLSCFALHARRSTTRRPTGPPAHRPTGAAGAGDDIRAVLRTETLLRSLANEVYGAISS